MTEKQHPSYTWIFWLLAVFGLILDIGSKYVIFAALYNGGQGGTYPLIPNAFQLTADYTGQPSPDGVLSPLRTISGDLMPRVNHGALFGMGQGKNTWFTVISLAAAVGIVWWSFRRASKSDRLLNISLGLILAGTVGNLYDRVVFNGVRDFLHWYYWINWPVFNIADCCLVCGASLLFIQAAFLHKESNTPGNSTEEVRHKPEEQLAPISD